MGGMAVVATECGGTSCAVQAHGSWYGSGRTRPGFSYFFRESKSGTRTRYGHQYSSISGFSILSLFFLPSFSFSSLLSLYYSIFTSIFLFPYFFTIKFLSTSPHFTKTPLAFVQIVMAFFSGCRVIYNTYRLGTESHFY